MERKKKKVTKQSEESKAKQPTSLEATYFRLCHFCFHLNEADQPIIDCTSCANLLSSEPIEEFYEDIFESVSALRSHSDEDEREERGSNLPPNPELRGLSVIW